MKIKTKYLGDLEVSPEQVIKFDSGLFGFEQYKDFALIDVAENVYFKVLQHVEESYVAFVLVNPWDFFPDYDIQLSDDELSKIGIQANEENDMLVYSIVTLGDSLKNSTCNLLAPLVINTKNNRGKQLIVMEDKYTTKHKLFQEEIGE